MIQKFNRTLELGCMAVSGLSITAMAAVAFVDSFGRPLSHPLPGGSEMVSYALMLFFFSSLPLLVKADSHIRVGLLTDFYSASARRFERLFTALVETAALAVLAWMVLDQAGRLTRFGTESVYFQTHVGPWGYVAGAFCVVAVWFALYGLFAPAQATGLPFEKSHAEAGVE